MYTHRDRVILELHMMTCAVVVVYPEGSHIIRSFIKEVFLDFFDESKSSKTFWNDFLKK